MTSDKNERLTEFRAQKVFIEKAKKSDMMVPLYKDGYYIVTRLMIFHPTELARLFNTYRVVQ